jgi:hypothetical protein
VTIVRECPRFSRDERGMALIVVVFVLIAVLAGGLAAIALTSGELAGTYGHRSRAVAESCAQAAIEKIRTRMPTFTVGDIADTYALPSGSTLTISATHNGLGDGVSPVIDVPTTSYDMTAMLAGENVTNNMGTVGSGIRIVTVVATCSGPGNSTQEVQVLMRYGVPGG